MPIVAGPKAESESSGLTLADIMDWFGDRADVMGQIRYGVPTSEKERLASAGALPGAPKDRSESQDVANRYAAGYLFAQQHPWLAPMVQPVVDRIKTSDLPFLGGASPELQSWASHGAGMAQAQPMTIGELMQPPPGRR